MSKGGDVATVLAILVAVNLLNNRLLPRAYVLTCVVAAGLLLLLGRRDGCSWAELGFGARQLQSGLRWAGVVVGLVLLADTVGVALPFTRQAFADTRATALTGGGVLWHVLVRIPLGTALLEEVAFRGVLYAMLARRYGVVAAIGGSSLLFGLWHVLPSVTLRHANAAVAGVVGAGTAGTAVTVTGATVGAALAGVALCELRRRSGGLLAPFALHWALNGLGLLLAWASSRASRP
jgi:membrane protease YdiL (CAAX protease family)